MAFFVFAGPGQNATGNSDEIWPKETNSGGTINGTKYACYACCNETYKGVPDGIGVFVHELSHALGLPDLYDTAKSVCYGLDYWDVMDSGCYCGDGYVPCNYSAYERDFMGWQSLVTLNPEEPQHLTLNPISSYGDGYKMVNAENENEYYIIENRQNKGWDTFFGRGSSSRKYHGLLVSHVDYVQAKWTANVVNTKASHQYYTIIPADSSLYSFSQVNSNEEYQAWLTDNAGDLYPGTTGLDSLTGAKAYVYTTTGETPNQLNQPLYNITENEDGTLELDYMEKTESTAIWAVAADEAVRRQGVFTVSGVRVANASGDELQSLNLPAGIYIWNNKKYIIR